MQSYKLYLEVYLFDHLNKKPRYKRILRQRSRSFVKQWVQLIKSNFQYVPEANVRDWGNVLRTAAQYKLSVEGAAGMYYNGIVLGTGETAVTISDYKMETLIVHGSGAGQLDYKAMAWDAFEVVGSTARFRNKRQFENKSGSTITVKEAGLYATDNAGYHFCIVRDVLSAPVDILNGQIIEVRYTFQAAV